MLFDRILGGHEFLTNMSRVDMSLCDVFYHLYLKSQALLMDFKADSGKPLEKMLLQLVALMSTYGQGILTESV